MSDHALAELQDALAGTLSIERELGRGGMGTVYLARDVALDRPCALKVLHQDQARDPAQRERFVREARTGARLSHPHIVPIYDVGESGDHVWFVMGLVDGESLRDRVARQGGLPADDVERLLREIGWALANAHARGILHRDVTLDNILIDRRSGRAMLADFGIAATLDGGDAGPLIGTAAYLAPDLIRGDPPSPQSDLYALGIVGWASLTGFLPFADEDPAAVLLRHLHDDLPSLERAAAATPSRLRRAIEVLLERDPSARPTTAEAWLELLEEPARSVQLAEPLSAWLQTRAAAAPYYALAMTLLAMATGFSLQIAAGSLVFGLIGATLIGGAVVLTLPLVVQAGIALSAIRRVARSGFGLEDLRIALDRHLAARRRAGPVRPSAVGRAIRHGGTVAGLAAALVLALAEGGGGLPWSIRFMLWDVGFPVLRWGLMLFWISRGIGFLVPGHALPPSDRRSRLRERFWRSRAAGWLFRAIRFGLPRTVVAEQTLHRPTELMLDLQIEELWHALPEETRRGFDDVPVVARGLRHRIREVRALLERLDEGGGDRGAGALAMRERLEHRRTEATSALERLRLLLTRLGGVAASPGELTRDLREARAVEGAILMDLGAHHDIHRLLRPGRLTPSPG
ncbi:MAG TPA: serine/threonine-protein kinase [Gemmatimonadales bacterium]|nr:serine/threonine-protein kinase [Gemmatimonadales bacterium]